MYEPTYNSLQPPPPEKPKTPVFGIISCVAAILSIVLFCGMYLLIFAVGSGSGFDPTQINYETLTGLGLGMIAMMCGSGLASIVGLILGVIGVVQKTTSKVWAIIGLVLNGLILFGYCILFAIGVLAGS